MDDAMSSVCGLTARQFTQVTSATSGNPAYWIVRVRAPWDVVPSPDLLAEAISDLSVGTNAPRPFVHLGELLLNNTDAWMVADALGLQQFPTVIMFNGKTLRAVAPRGALQYGKVLALPRPIQIPIRSKAQPEKAKEELSKTILANVPTRYVDGVTGQYVDALNFVFSRKEVYQMASLRKDQVQIAGVLSALPTRAVVLRLRLSEKGDEAMLAAASAAAAESGANTIVFVTEDADVAGRFHITENRRGAVFAFPFPDDVSVPITPLHSISILETPADVAGCVLNVDEPLTINPNAATERILSAWKKDIRTMHQDKPLRMLQTQSDFLTHVEECKVSIVILFFLRESDDFFMRGYHVAEEIAKAIETQWGSHWGEAGRAKPHPLTATRDRIRFEVFWIDAELQKQVASTMKIPSVPSVCFLYNLQDGRRGVRFVQGGKKQNEFPTSSELLAFMSGSALMDPNTREMFPVDLSTVTFLPEEDVATFYRGKSPKLLRVTVPGTSMLVTDRKVYPEQDAKESTFVSQMVEGKIKLDAQKQPEDASASKVSKLSPKAEAKKKKKEEAARKKIEEELAERKRAKEERMKKKSEEDAKWREDEKAKAKAALKEERKKQKSREEQPGAAAAKSTRTAAENTVSRPKFNPAKGPKNRHTQKKDWEVDRKLMMGQRLSAAKGGGVSFNKQFEL